MKMPIRLGPWLEGEGKVNVDKNGDLSKEHTQSWRFLHLLTDPCSTKDTVQWFGQVRRSREIDEGECTTSLMLLCFMSYSAFACAGKFCLPDPSDGPLVVDGGSGSFRAIADVKARRLPRGVPSPFPIEIVLRWGESNPDPSFTQQ